MNWTYTLTGQIRTVVRMHIHISVDMYIERYNTGSSHTVIAHKIRYTECMGSMDTLAPTASRPVPWHLPLSLHTNARNHISRHSMREVYVSFLFLFLLSSFNSYTFLRVRIYRGSLSHGLQLSNCPGCLYIRNIKATERLHKFYLTYHFII